MRLDPFITFVAIIVGFGSGVIAIRIHDHYAPRSYADEGSRLNMNRGPIDLTIPDRLCRTIRRCVVRS
jgi:hypothetical protein